MNRGVWQGFKAGLPEDVRGEVRFSDFQEFSSDLDLSPRRALRAWQESWLTDETGDIDFAAAKTGKRGHSAPDATPTDDGTADDGAVFTASAKSGGGGGKGKPTPPPPPPPPPPEPAVNTPDANGIYSTYHTGIGDAGFVSNFNLELTFGAGWTAGLQADILRAAEYVSALVTGDLADIGSIDDVKISIALVSIDGTNGTVARGAATGFRADGTSYQGAVQFDTADIAAWSAQGRLDDVAVHEMLHAMGFGTRWVAMGLTAPAGGVTRFTGDNATAAWQDEFAGIAGNDPYAAFGVPVEMDGGSGTAGVHWDEMTFFDELMTGYLGGDNYVSATSVAALEDMGYETVFDIAATTAPVIQLDDIMLV